jgi:phosphatidate cytidylyltransferase
LLIQRIITALVLLPIVLAALFLLEPDGFAVFAGVVVALAAWEWARLAGLHRQVSRVLYALVVVAIVATISLTPDISRSLLLYAALAWWVVSLFLVISFPSSSTFWESTGVRIIIGVYILVPFWVAIVFMRSADVVVYPGLSPLWLIFYTLFIVFAADTGAYFAGKTLGKSKLAPKVSPGKSWAGFWGGLISACLLALAACVQLDVPASFYVQLVILTAITSVFSVVGDLTESMFKRQAGIKDSSQLLPGHGGVMDRIDSLVAAFPVMTSLLLIFGWIQ